MKNQQINKSTILISVIAAAVLTLLFFVVKITAIFIAAYIITLIGIALLCLGRLYLFENIKSYPWLAAFPQTIKRYLFLQVPLSAIFVILDQFDVFSLPVPWFLVIHILLFAFFAVVLISLKSGKEIIEKRDEEIKEKVTALRFMQADMESLMRKFPEHEKDLKQVAEALRYSDPMSHSSLAVY
ncbi:MAG: hypothetical protein FWH48_10725 [Oscillospiraceae bacterium]|nr:hypothetical protein [Oscillospiraceae bacterium]